MRQKPTSQSTKIKSYLEPGKQLPRAKTLRSAKSKVTAPITIKVGKATIDGGARIAAVVKAAKEEARAKLYNEPAIEVIQLKTEKPHWSFWGTVRRIKGPFQNDIPPGFDVCFNFATEQEARDFMLSIRRFVVQQ